MNKFLGAKKKKKKEKRKKCFKVIFITNFR